LTVAGAVAGTANVHGVRVAPDLDRVFATASGSDQVVAIQASSLTVTGRAPTGRFPDGVAYDPDHKAVFVSNKDDGSETVVDASTLAVRRTVRLAGEVGNVVWDSALQRMLVAAESGVVAVFEEKDGGLHKLGQAKVAGAAHTVAVDPTTHRVFFPLENVHGHPVLRIMAP